MNICLFHLNSYACYLALLAKDLHWEEVLLVHPAFKPKYSCHPCPPYLPICGISSPLQVNFHVLPLKPSNCFSLCDNVFSSWRSKKLGLLSSILLGTQTCELHLACHFNFSKRAGVTTTSKRKGTPPRNVNVWSAPEDSVSHGLWKQRMGGVSQFYKSKEALPKYFGTALGPV